jgi:hypothetical protein
VRHPQRRFSLSQRHAPAPLQGSAVRRQLEVLHFLVHFCSLLVQVPGI